MIFSSCVLYLLEINIEMYKGKYKHETRLKCNGTGALTLTMNINNMNINKCRFTFGMPYMEPPVVYLEKNYIVFSFFLSFNLVLLWCVVFLGGVGWGVCLCINSSHTSDDSGMILDHLVKMPTCSHYYSSRAVTQKLFSYSFLLIFYSLTVF